MRRIFAAALLVLFLSQSSGIALADQSATSRGASPVAELALAVQPSIAAVQGSQVVALLEGNVDRYASMHAPPPNFTPVARTVLVPPSKTLQARPVLARYLGPGTPAHTEMLTVNPGGANGGRDPLAERKSQTEMLCSGAVTFSTLTTLSLKTPQNCSPKVLAPIFPSPRLPEVQKSRPLTSTTMSITSTPSATGINPWWSYEESAIPGAGKWMVNVATGNLIVQDDDIDIPGRGIDLAFRRTFNSQSQHDTSNSDGSVPSVYGNGWTNTFDAHLAYDPSGPTMSVYDIDGARYDYSSSNGRWVAPPGQHATLATDGTCGYYWTKKNGTRYYFWSPTYSSCSATNSAGVNGRLYQIQARNHNNIVTLKYTWTSGDASSPTNVQQIAAVHAGGQQLVLQFSDVSSHRLLTSITRPDGQIVRYAYDASGNLTDVCTPGNGTVDNSPGAATVCGDTTHRHHRYGWNSGGYGIAWADSPKWVSSWGGPDQTGSGGAYVDFFEDSSARAVSVQDVGYANFRPNDGTATLLQPGVTDNTNNAGIYRNSSFSYAPGTSSFWDTDGHSVKWNVDTIGRVTSQQRYTGAAENVWLVTSSGWDANNNLISSTDARGSETDYGYDGNGNTLWVQQPWVQTNWGNIRPVSRYSYDQYNNLLAYCDPVYIGNTGATNCPQVSGVTHYSYDYSDTRNEPFGRLTDSYTPLGFHRAFLYTTGGQQGQQWGLVTDVNSDCFTQFDGSNNCGHQGFSYNANGNMTYYSAGVGNWTVAYDSLNRVISAADPDGVTSRTCYNFDGSVSAKQTSYQYALDGNVVCGNHSVLYSYDADGNVSSETHHFGQTSTVNPAPGVTKKWYDGGDRLIEVQLPSDKYTDNSVDERTRYIYDLSQGGQVQITATNQSPAFRAYGNLYKTQKFLLYNNVGTWTFSSTPTDINGNAYDALDRSVTRYQYSPGNGLQAWTTIYDSAPYTGLLVSKRDPVGVITTYAYDGVNRENAISFSDTTPSRSYTFDADGRTMTSVSSTYGTDSYQYDADGRATQYVEGAGGGSTSPATITYGYYGNGARSALSVSSSGFSQSNEFQYSYRVDGQRAKLAVAGQSQPFAWVYSNAGREQQQSDPFTGLSVAGTSSPVGPYFSAHTLSAATSTYDNNGQLASLELPNHGTYANITRDTEGNVASYQLQADDAPNGTGNVGGFVYDYDVRGEQATTEAINGNSPYATGSFLYGHSCSATVSGASGAVNNVPAQDCAGVQVPVYGTNKRLVAAANVDAYTGASFTGAGGYDSTTSTSCSAVYIFGSSALSYDLDGRQSNESLDFSRNGCGAQDPSLNYRSYDAEDHIVQDKCAPNGADGEVDAACTTASDQYVQNTATLGWGTGGKLRVGTNISTSCAGGQLTMHWDGDNLLFITDSSGKLVQTDVETLGAIQNGCSGPLKVIDRDVSGLEVALHSSQGDGLWAYGQPTFHMYGKGVMSTAAACVGCNGQQPDFSSSLILNPIRKDGYQIRGFTVQGVRSFDYNTEQWTAPDAYKGDVHDPISQRSYMWNNNNPIAYSDPSGYDALLDFVANGAGGLGHVQVITYDNATLKGNVNSLESTHGHPFGDKTAISHTAVGNVRDLPTDGHSYFHLSTTASQNKAIQASYDSHSNQNYNVLTNNCETTADAALESAGIDLRSLDASGIPNLDKIGLDHKQASPSKPSDIKPQPQPK